MHAPAQIRPSTIPQGFGLRLRGERERLGLSQAQLAAAGGVQRLAQGQYELEKSSPPVRYLIEISKVGADVELVLFGRSRSDKPLSPSEVNRIESRAFEALEKFVAERPEETFDAAQKFGMFKLLRGSLTKKVIDGAPLEDAPTI